MGEQREPQMSFSGTPPTSFETVSLLGLEFTNYAGQAWPMSLHDHFDSSTLCWTDKRMLPGSPSLSGCWFKHGSSMADHPLHLMSALLISSHNFLRHDFFLSYLFFSFSEQEITIDLCIGLSFLLFGFWILISGMVAHPCSPSP